MAEIEWPAAQPPRHGPVCKPSPLAPRLLHSQVAGLLQALLSAAAGGDGEAARSLRKLAELTTRMEGLEGAASEGAAESEYALLEDEARAARSAIRMWGKDGERFMPSSMPNWLEELRKRL